MANKLTIEEFIRRSKNIHGEKYDYSLVEYINSQKKIKIICKKHSIFEQTPSCHLSGRRCPICYGTPRKNQKEFIDECKIIHNNKYDYSLVDYKNKHLKIKIICPEHGIFEQCSRSHLRGHGCPHCVGLAKHTTESFIKKSIEIHGNRYNYSLVDYKGNKSKIKIICQEHGIFIQIPTDHLNGHGCPSCVNKFRYNTETFIKKSISIHGEKYDYSLVNFKNNKIKVKLICPIHGTFETRPDNHINSKNGCPKCSESLGEKEISVILNKLGIKYDREKKFKGCKYVNLLSFDFYLPEYNTCIEYDGKQHYESINFFGGNKEFKKLIVKDNIKTKFCQDNNIKLLRIRYDERIDEKIKLFLNKISL